MVFLFTAAFSAANLEVSSGTLSLLLSRADCSNATDTIHFSGIYTVWDNWSASKQLQASIKWKHYYCSTKKKKSMLCLKVVNVNFWHQNLAATSVTWTAPPPAWNQTDPNDIRTVDILVFNRSTQVQLKWNYILSAGSSLQLTTFSIIDGGSSNDIGFQLHGSDTATIYNNYRARFNINTSEVATLIIKRATEREENDFPVSAWGVRGMAIQSSRQVDR